jgi:uncharacterized protein YjbI with pentapeptide repeats
MFSGVDLTKVVFIECTFDGCDLSMTTLNNTSLREIKFKNCKMLGLHFEECNPFLFEVSFSNCQLNLSSFYQRRLKQTVFSNCQLQEVDFAEADLTAAKFDNCDLTYAVFSNTILEKADFTTSHSYILDPETNYLTGARFSLDGLPGLLTKYAIEIE